MTDMLKNRPSGLARPIFLADALARNFPKVVEEATKVAKCLIHGRRYFVDLGLKRFAVTFGAQIRRLP